MKAKLISLIAILSLLAVSTGIVVNAQTQTQISYVKFNVNWVICLPTGCTESTANNASIGISLDRHTYTIKHTNSVGVLKIHELPNIKVYYWVCDPNSPIFEQCPSQATFGNITTGANDTTVFVSCLVGSYQSCRNS